MVDPTDPLHDPRFPDRPSHPDFWRISDAVLQLDGKADEGGQSFSDIVAGLVDADSVTYMATNRAARARAAGAGGAAVWLDGFVAGLLFAEKGGHRS